MRTQMPVVAFEHYMLADDQPGYDMTVAVRFWFKGLIDRAVFEPALGATLQEHPLFQARLSGHPRRRTRQLGWVFGDALVMPYMSWESEAVPLQAPPAGTGIDLAQEIGLRLYVREGVDRTLLVAQFHHAVCDGVGLCGFFEDVLKRYALQAPGTSTPAAPKTLTIHRDASLLTERGRFGLTRGARWRRLGKDLALAFKFFRTFPAMLSPTAGILVGRRAEPLPAGRQTFLTAEHAVLAPETVAGLRAQLKTLPGATLNDLFLRDLFQTLGAWNAACAGCGHDVRHRAQAIERQRRLRIAVPMCLRRPEDAAMPAANVVGMVFLTRTDPQCQEPAALLRGITRETRILKAHHMGIAMVRVVGWLGRRGSLAKFLAAPIVPATAVLTNLGRPYLNSELNDVTGRVAAGGLVLEHVEILPPLRRGCRVAFSVNTYGEALGVSMRYDALHMSAGEAQRLLAQFCQRLQSSARPPPGSCANSVSRRPHGEAWTSRLATPVTPPATPAAGPL